MGRPAKAQNASNSGLTYTWDSTHAVPGRVTEVRKNGIPLDLRATYSVAVNSFLSDGGDNFFSLTGRAGRQSPGTDLDALEAYIKALPQPISCPKGGRCIRTK